ncbi:MAG: hypothetical protein MJ121_06410 [Clostridia bacterium]|nr:hypothetical protein [Clostridia bacterium]
MHDHHEHHHHEAADANEAKVLLKYMLDHNKSHTNDLEKLALKLKEAGSTEACEDVMKAMEIYNKGNELLESALSKAGE